MSGSAPVFRAGCGRRAVREPDGRHLDHELAGRPGDDAGCRPGPRVGQVVQRGDTGQRLVAVHRQRDLRRAARIDAPGSNEVGGPAGQVASGVIGGRRGAGADREHLGALHRDRPDRRVERSVGANRVGRDPAADRPSPEVIERHELPVGRRAGDLVRRERGCGRRGRRLGDAGHRSRGRPSGRGARSRWRRVAPRAEDRRADDQRGGDRDPKGRGSPAGDGCRGYRLGCVHAWCPNHTPAPADRILTRRGAHVTRELS